MKQKYKFVDDVVIEVEVEGEIGEVLEEMNRKDRNRFRQQRRYESHLDIEQDKDYWNDSSRLLYLVEKNEEAEQAIKWLGEETAEFISKIYLDKKPISEIAAEEGVSRSAIYHRLITIRKNLKNFLNDPHI